MKKLLDKRWFQALVVIAILGVFILFMMSRKRKSVIASKAFMNRGEREYKTIIAIASKSFSPSEKTLWDKISGITLTAEESKLISQKGEEGMEQVLKKRGLTDSELDALDGIYEKLEKAMS